MFFPHLMSIKDDDLVLEIGPGAYPYWRSDCLLDKFDNSSDTDISQFGGAPQQTLNKPLFKMENNVIPFKDKSFDYVICSHVLEHINHDQIEAFLSEIQRVSDKVYIEFPRILYDYIYDFDVHLNFMDIVDGIIICLPKTTTCLANMKQFTRFALELRKSSGFAVESLNPSFLAIGQEFEGVVPLRVYDNEKRFFEALQSPFKPISKPSLLWLGREYVCKMKRGLGRHPDRKYFEGLLQ